VKTYISLENRMLSGALDDKGDVPAGLFLIPFSDFSFLGGEGGGFFGFLITALVS
jgi:hypothetical protein